MAVTVRAAFAATWRDEAGEVVATTWGGTMCWFPRKPWRIRIWRDGFEHIVRCGECPGCLEFERRRLADRLHARYASGPASGAATSTPTGCATATAAAGNALKLFSVRIWCGLGRQAELSRKMHRCPNLELEPGMYRLGAGSFAVLSYGTTRITSYLRARGFRFRIEPVRLGRGRRAWRAITAGLTVAREVYGENLNRWYARGLPAAEKNRWEVRKIDAYSKYSRASSPRAWKNSRLVLVPPEVWKLRSADRVSIKRLLGRAPNPEGVALVERLVATAVGAMTARASAIAPSAGKLTREQVVQWYQRMAQGRKARTDESAALDPNSPPSEGGGYVSSEHLQGELTPKIMSEEDLMAQGSSGKPLWMERERADVPDRMLTEEGRKAKHRRELDAALERLRQRIVSGGGHGKR